MTDNYLFDKMPRHFQDEAQKALNKIAKAAVVKLTPTEKQILDFLKELFPKSASPTEIGISVGQKLYAQASSWASPKIKSLHQKGLVGRDEKGRTTFGAT